MQTLQTFNNLITQLRNPASAETMNAMQMLNTRNPNDISTLIELRMQYQPPFFNSVNQFMFNQANSERDERAFAATVPGLDQNLWVNFVTAIRAFVQNPQQQQ